MNFTYLPTLQKRNCWSRPLLPFRTEGTVSISASPPLNGPTRLSHSVVNQTEWNDWTGYLKGPTPPPDANLAEADRVWVRKEKMPMHLRYKICFQRSIRLKNLSKKLYQWPQKNTTAACNFSNNKYDHFLIHFQSPFSVVCSATTSWPRRPQPRKEGGASGLGNFRGEKWWSRNFHCGVNWVS